MSARWRSRPHEDLRSISAPLEELQPKYGFEPAQVVDAAKEMPGRA
jgi:hypothetical protein